MKKEFLSFLIESEKVPHDLYNDTKGFIGICIKPFRTIIKFYLLQLGGMFLTLLVCPQYGFNPVLFGNLAHYLFQTNPVTCAIFCSSVFFGAGAMLNFYFLNRPESKWVINNILILTLPLNILVFLMMLFSKSISIDSHMTHMGASFDLVWATTSVVVCGIFYFISKKKLSLAYSKSVV